MNLEFNITDIKKSLYWFFILPIIIFSLPLGAGNSLAQPLALILLLPLFFLSLRYSLLGLMFFIWVVFVSFVQANLSDEFSLYQSFRTGIPFLYLCVILSSYHGLCKVLETTLSNNGKSEEKLKIKKYFTITLYIYAFGQAFQILLFMAGLELANAASSTPGGRILLFPTTCTLLIFMYAASSGRYLLMAVLAFVLLSSGSKAVLGVMGVMALVAVLRSGSLIRVVQAGVAGVCLVVVIANSNLLIVDRVMDFLFEERFEDVTREYEIYHAKEEWSASTGNMMFGLGLAVPLTPGILTSDPRWAENSKYDIENGYWSLLPKLGILGVLIFLYLFWRLPRDYWTAAIAIIWLVFSFKTSYQFFTTFDGSMLLLASLILRAVDALDRDTNDHKLC